MKHWWKILGVVLILYSLTAGMLIPLKPGIIEITPNVMQTGIPSHIDVKGYNTHYETASVQQAYIKIEDQAIKADRIKAIDEKNLQVEFTIPDIPGDVTNATLVIDNNLDGAMLLPDGIIIRKGASSSATSFINSIDLMDSDVGIRFPYRAILEETIRNTFFHVVLWLAMMIIFSISVVHSIWYLRKRNIDDDLKSEAYASVGVLLGILGIVTGAIWAKYTWGAFWSWDVKQNMAAVAMLIYGAYFIIRKAMSDQDAARRIGAVYNVFAFLMLIPLLFVLPRMTDSLHPGSGGNPALGSSDLDNTLRMIFYPTIIGWILLGIWIANIRYRLNKIELEL